ncbi:MAG: hypothetical protein J5662_05120, partial [Clostridia bacterium]|nr:hypothetical protein [Clostridia bacterium]
MNFKKIACLILMIAVLFSLCGCGNDNKIIIQKAPFDAETLYDIPEDKTLATAGDYTLLLNGKYGFPVLTKAGCERTWDLSPTGFLDGWNYEYGVPVSASSLFLKYYDPEYDAFFTANSSDAVKNGRVKFDQIDNGIKITYFFDEFKISVPVSYTVNENGLSVRLLPEEIDENDYPVVSVSVAPFLCSAENEKNKDRYLFVPSGSGALMYTDNRGEVRNYEEEVYGDDLSRSKKWNYVNSEQIYLPVFGAVDGKNAIYGIIKSGDQSSSVGAYAGDKS